MEKREIRTGGCLETGSRWSETPCTVFTCLFPECFNLLYSFSVEPSGTLLVNLMSHDYIKICFFLFLKMLMYCNWMSKKKQKKTTTKKRHYKRRFLVCLWLPKRCVVLSPGPRCRVHRGGETGASGEGMSWPCDCWWNALRTRVGDAVGKTCSSQTLDTHSRSVPLIKSWIKFGLYIVTFICPRLCRCVVLLKLTL